MRLSSADKARRRQWVASFRETKPGEFTRRRVARSAGRQIRQMREVAATALGLGFDPVMIATMVELEGMTPAAVRAYAIRRGLCH